MPLVDVAMPKMGESITEGTVIAWHKAVGEAVELDETLLEIGTDKVDTDVPSPSAGTLVEILANEGDTVEVGTVIARLDTAGGAPAAPASPAVEAPPAAAPAAAAEPVVTPPPPPAAPVTEAPSAPAAQAAADSAAPAPPAPTGGARIEVAMPKMGESITEGTVIAWHKAVGEAVELDETLLEIGTDKVDTDVPSPSAGTLVEILANEGDTVEVGTVIAILSTGAAAGVAASAPAPAAPAAAAPAPIVTPPPPPPSTTASGTSTATEAASLQEQVPPGAPETAAYDASASPSAPSATAPAAPAASGSPSEGDGGPIGRTDAQGRFVSPLVRSIAEKEGLTMDELSALAGRGSGGRVSKDDVLAYLDSRSSAPQAAAPSPPPQAAPAAAPALAVTPPPPAAPRAAAPAPAPAASYGDRVEIVEMDRMRRIIAEHMVRSKATSPHVTSFAEIDVTNLVRNREANKAAFEKEYGVKLTFTPYFVQAAVDALRTHPILNASVEGDRILIRKDIHVGIAVALGTSGLMAPVIRNAGDKNLVGLARAAADLAARTRSKQLQPDELQGGTFTVTNIGSLGSLMGTPIINQPQVAILATGAIKKRPAVIEDPVLGDVIAVRSMMYVSLSYDHRIIDGSMASSYLAAYVAALEGIDPNGSV